MADSMTKIGHWAFLAGVAIAVLAGLVTFPSATVILVVLGLVVGLLNVTTRETTAFLIASAVLLLAGSAGLGSLPPPLGTFVGSILSNIAAFVAPAGVIVALRAVFALASEE